LRGKTPKKKSSVETFLNWEIKSKSKKGRGKAFLSYCSDSYTPRIPRIDQYDQGEKTIASSKEKKSTKNQKGGRRSAIAKRFPEGGEHCKNP